MNLLHLNKSEEPARDDRNINMCLEYLKVPAGPKINVFALLCFLSNNTKILSPEPSLGRV